jgi:hypothetical protein
MKANLVMSPMSKQMGIHILRALLEQRLETFI